MARVLIRAQGVRVRTRGCDLRSAERWEDAAGRQHGGPATSQGTQAASGSQKREGNGFSPRAALPAHFRLLTSTTVGE